MRKRGLGPTGSCARGGCPRVEPPLRPGAATCAWGNPVIPSMFLTPARGTQVVLRDPQSALEPRPHARSRKDGSSCGRGLAATDPVLMDPPAQRVHWLQCCVAADDTTAPRVSASSSSKCVHRSLSQRLASSGRLASEVRIVAPDEQVADAPPVQIGNQVRCPNRFDTPPMERPVGEYLVAIGRPLPSVAQPRVNRNARCAGSSASKCVPNRLFSERRAVSTSTSAWKLFSRTIRLPSKPLSRSISGWSNSSTDHYMGHGEPGHLDVEAHKERKQARAKGRVQPAHRERRSTGARKTT